MKKNLRYYYDHAEELLLVFCIIATVVLIFVQVIMRYILNDSLTWSEELARYIFIWESWLGISLGQKKGQHIAVNMLTNRLKGNVRKYTLVLADVCTIVFIAILVAKGLEVTNKILSMGSTSAAMHIPMFWIYLSMPVGCGLMGLRLLEDIYKKIRFDVEEVV